MTIVLTDGRILTGVKVAETDQRLTLGDPQGKKHVLAKSAIEELRVQSRSIMPDGIEKRLTAEEVVALVAFLVSQKETGQR